MRYIGEGEREEGDEGGTRIWGNLEQIPGYYVVLGQTVGGGAEDFGGTERSHSRLPGQVFFLFFLFCPSIML
jgi:hypothetical protein